MKNMISVLLLVLTCNAFFIFDRPPNRKLADPVIVKTQCNQVDAKAFSAEHVDGQLMFSGYLNVKPASNSALAFLFYPAQTAKEITDISKHPTVIWFNGGPGSSSQLGNFLELGPVFVLADGSFKQNPDSWNKKYNLLVIDQPIGTGFSYFETLDDIPTNQDVLAEQFVYAYDQFFTNQDGCVKKFNLDGLTTSKWFIFGESYAGKYVPNFADAVLKHNAKAPALILPLHGVGIGDGFTDPVSIMSELGSFSYNLGLIDAQERAKVDSYALQGKQAFKRGDTSSTKKFFYKALNLIIAASGGMNVYDIFTYGTYDARIGKFSQLLASEENKQKLKFIKEIDFTSSSGEVWEKFDSDFMKTDCIERLSNVAKKIPTLVYQGQNDLIVPNPGTLKLIDVVDYPQAEEFRNKDLSVWKWKNAAGVEQVVGYTKKAGNLQFNLINNVGHLCPMDNGPVAYELLTSFIDAIK